MRLLPVLLLFLNFHSIVAQQDRVVGQVVDATTNKPLPYANIIHEDQRRGTSADREGRFSFVVDKIKGEVLRFKVSFVGYKPEYVSIEEQAPVLVKLTPQVNDLAEVKIYPLLEKISRKINNFRGKSFIGLGNFSGGQFPSIVARFFSKPQEFKEGCFIREVEVRFFRDHIQRNKNAKFRLRVLSVGKEGLPADDLLNNNIIVQRSATQLKTKIDLLPYRITVPDKGFFVAVEHLFIRDNRYIEQKDYQLNDTLYKDVKVVKYAPIFKGTLEKNDKHFKSYFKDIGGWKKMNNLDTSNPLFEGKIPSPAFKIVLTD